MEPPVPIVSSSGWAWTVIRVGTWSGRGSVAEGSRRSSTHRIADVGERQRPGAERHVAGVTPAASPCPRTLDRDGTRPRGLRHSHADDASGAAPLDGTTPAIEALEAAGVPFTVVRTEIAHDAEESAAFQGIRSGRCCARSSSAARRTTTCSSSCPGGRRFDWPKLRAHLGTNRLSLPDRGGGEADDRLRAGRDHAVRRAPAWPVIADASIEGLDARRDRRRCAGRQRPPRARRPVRATGARGRRHQRAGAAASEPPAAERSATRRAQLRPGRPLPIRPRLTAATIDADGAQPHARSRQPPRRPRPDRSPASASRTARRSSPGRYCYDAPRATSGADVVKVEPPEGDVDPRLGPAVGRRRGGRDADRGLLPGRQPQQALDPPRPQDGRPAATSCGGSCAEADVARSRTTASAGFARLGFDDAALAAINPDLVHLAISGFGPDGPDAAKPGYDFVVQAVGGLMSITGAARRRGRAGRPRSGSRSATSSPGCSRAVAILAALLARERAGDGRASRPADRRVAPRERRSRCSSTRPRTRSSRVVAPGRLGNAHPNIVPYETFVTADGELALAVGSERQWPRLCEAARRCPGLADGPRGSRPTATG